MNHLLYLSDKQLADRYGVTRTTIWRWVQKNEFPHPIKISSGCTRWPMEEIERHETERMAARG